ncbi:his operon leader peptide [Escherichia coli]|uniref:his operon leader peptide n=18 Tax=Enterobacteriaceae TaxID=543 RepID=LPHI_SHIFL|nr:RecName: Full=his operon leader peptide; AltName: Full=his operon attenuator peptide [Shigella flexneri]Q8Z5K2.1 RecName: Full=his operon leader peptide; AltName: Full=his operon attenuator peptide [Salmonella enterica subsp. enterica serovar Typhi]pir/AB0764/ his operon leader peptide [imported] - Salmonella enterica subsp. enterica serovar Typhi (strain CT18) [Salmonella enterica subsp. enterica serovar Typhi]AAN43620.1 his operon leader peptide [Shigella flexneri 2a str. 301]AAO68494.1 hi
MTRVQFKHHHHPD